MKQAITFVLALTFSFLLPAQNAIVGTGFSNGWGGGSCPTGNSNFSYFGSGASTTYIRTTNANGTGNQFFRLAIDWSGTTAQRTITIGSDVAVTPGTKYTLNTACTTTGAMFYNVPNASYNYVFKTLNAGTNPTGTFTFFEIQGTVESVSAVAQAPVSSSVNQSVPVVVTATLSNSFSTGQAAYLRYTTNNFATSTVLKMSGSGTSYTGTIPGQTQGAVVRYYVFTSGDVASISSSDADLYTINLENNGGANFSYTVLGPLAVSLSEFRAARKGNTVELSWETVSEQDHAYFEVERSQNARDWQSLGKVEGRGALATRSLYTYTDAQAQKGLNYYRLRSIGTDGEVSFSASIAIQLGRTVAFTVAPNPVVSDVLRLRIDADDEQVFAIQLFNNYGQLVKSWPEQQTEVWEFNISELPVGNYWLSVNGEQAVPVLKMW